MDVVRTTTRQQKREQVRGSDFNYIVYLSFPFLTLTYIAMISIEAPDVWSCIVPKLLIPFTLHSWSGEIK
jgi:hypothetical protein